MHSSNGRALAGFAVRILSSVVTTAALHGVLASEANAAQGEPRWRGATYAVPATRAPMGEVLSDLARSVGMDVHVTKRAAAVPTTLDAQPPTGIAAFLDSLSQRYRLDWFVYRGSLYGSLSSEAREMRLDVPQARQHELRTFLESLKLLDDRFLWMPMGSSNIVLVMGPPDYLQLVRQETQRLLELGDGGTTSASVRAARPESEELQPMVFRLRHATAADRAPDDPEGDGLTTQPGVATQLSMLMGASSTSYQSTLDAGRRMSLLRQNAPVQQTPDGIDRPLYEEVRSQAAMAVSQTDLSGLQASIRGAGRITADPRTNSILVRDKISLRPQYEKFIAALDVPQPMLGLDALVFELPAGRARALLASTPGSIASSSLSGAARVLSATDAVALLEKVANLRAVDTRVDMATHGISFRQGSAIALDFRDATQFPSYSVPIWDRLLRFVFRLPEAQDPIERVMALTITGSARVQDDGRIGLQMNVSDERTDPLMSDKTIDQRSTRMRAGADIRNDEVLMLVASTYAIGRENKPEPRVRLILLSARCSSCNSGSGS